MARPRAGRWRWLLPLAIFLVALAPRAADLRGFVTADELRWTCRGLVFRAALADGDWGGTYQTGHPGVSVMWLAAAPAAGPELRPVCRDSPSAIAEDAPWSARAGLRDALYGARARLAVAHAALLALCVALAAPLLGARAAALGGVLLACEPFLVGLSRVLHLDALAGELMLLSLLMLLHHARRGRRRWLVASGAAAGLALLTKATALTLAPVAAALLIAPAAAALLVARPTAGALPGTRPAAEPRRAPVPGAAAGRRLPASALELQAALAHAGLWAAAALLTATAAWPALWTAPLATTGAVLGQALGYAVEAQKTTSFFLGGRVEDPGWRFYPLLLLLRSTPLLLAGLALAPAALARQSERRRALVTLAAYAVFYALAISVAEKKYDRYLLPAVLAAGFLAGAGWDRAAALLERALGARAPLSPPRARRAAGALVAALVVGGGLWTAAEAHPYAVAWYSPLAGGTPGAARWTLLGWGEGLEQVAEHLNTLPAAEEVRVVGWGAAMGLLFQGRVLRDTPANRAVADYLVVYVSDVQTGHDRAMVLADGAEPLFTARVRGMDYAWVVPAAQGAAPP